MLKKLLFFTAVAFSAVVQAQELTVHVDKKGRIGFVDQHGNQVVKCKYDSALPFERGVAVVGKSDKYGLIDRTGKEILSLKYLQITKWTDDLYLVKDKKTMGLADRTGKLVLPVKYTQITRPNCYGLALISSGGKVKAGDKGNYVDGAKRGIINKYGEIVIPAKYKGLYEFAYDGSQAKVFHEGMRLIYNNYYLGDTLKTDCSYLGFDKKGASIFYAGVMDGAGKTLVKPGLYQYVMMPKSGMVRYYNKGKKKSTVCGYHDLSTGKGFKAATFDSSIDDLTFWTHGDFIGNIAPVNGSNWSFVDKSGTTLRSGYSAVRHSAETALWAARNSAGKWEVFDDQNRDLAGLSNYSEILFPNSEDAEEVFMVKKGDRYGGVNRSGTTVIPFDYDDAFGNRHDFIAVKKDGKWGFLSPSNVTLVPTQYLKLFFPEERGTKDVWVVNTDTLYYHYSVTAKRLGGKGYNIVENFKDGLALAIPVGMKVADTQLNRAQLAAPKTPKATLDKLDLAKMKDSFGYLVNTNDVVVMDLPVSTYYTDAVRKEIEKHGGKTLTATEKKNILLDVTRENRSYDLKVTISEDEWNY